MYICQNKSKVLSLQKTHPKGTAQIPVEKVNFLVKSSSCLVMAIEVLYDEYPQWNIHKNENTKSTECSSKILYNFHMLPCVYKNLNKMGYYKAFFWQNNLEKTITVKCYSKNILKVTSATNAFSAIK